MVSAELKQFGRIVLSSIVNYIVLGGIFAFWYVLDTYVPPFHQRFSLQNYTIQYPHTKDERITFNQTVVVAFLAPAVIILFYSVVVDGFFIPKRHRLPRHALFQVGSSRRSQRRVRGQLWELNSAWLGLGLAQALAFLATAVLKRMGGKPRPDLIARCLPKPGSVDPRPFGLSDVSICTQTNKRVLNDGFMSFPSGHSSASFAGLTFLSVYLYHKLHPYRRQDHQHQNWRMLISVIPILGAAMIAITRIMDARHHPFDVLSGSALGILTAIVGWKQYLPVSQTGMPVVEQLENGGEVFLPVHEDGEDIDDDEDDEDEGAV